MQFHLAIRPRCALIELKILHATPTTSPSKVLTRIVRRESHKASGCEQQLRWNILTVHTRHHVNLCGASTECVRVNLCEETL